MKNFRFAPVLAYSLFMLLSHGVQLAQAAPCTDTIDTSAELVRIKTADAGDVVCVSRNVTADAVSMTTSGTAAAPIIYQFNGATFERFAVLANNVVVDDIHVDMQGQFATTLRNTLKGDNITLRNSLIENGGKTLIWIPDGNDMVIRNNVFKDAVKAPFTGSNCIAHQGGSSNGLEVTQNEFRNCASDGLQITQAADALYPRNVEIAYNDIYITPLLHVDGGDLACAENALDFKGGRDVHVHHNAMWGFRPTKTSCSGTGEDGYAIKLHRLANNYLIENNNMFDIRTYSGECVFVAPAGSVKPDGSPNRVHDVTFRNNACHGVGQGGQIDGIGRAGSASSGVLQFSAAAYEIDEAAGDAVITANRVGGSAGSVSVSYTTTSGGTAIEGADYNFVDGFLSWRGGDAASKTFRVPIIDGGDAGGDETVNLALSNPDGGATLGSRSAAVLTIIDNDDAPVVTCAGRVATIVGTDRSEHIDGTADADVIHALAGDDVITGLGGDDRICGGANDDRLIGSGGNDTLNGGNDNDVLDGGAGIDACNGGFGKNDTRTACEEVIAVP